MFVSRLNAVNRVFYHKTNIVLLESILLLTISQISILGLSYQVNQVNPPKLTVFWDKGSDVEVNPIASLENSRAL